jgi:signal transduction histidine kinase
MSAVMVASFVVAAVAAVLGMRRPAAVAACAGVTAAASLVTTALTGPDEPGIAYWLLAELIVTLVVIARTVRRLAPRPAATLSAVLVGAVGLAPLRVARGVEPPAPAREVVAVCVVFAVVAGLAVAAGGYLRALDRARAQIAAAARREQRLRLAGDLHDWLGHEITGIVLEAQAGKLDADAVTAPTFTRIEAAGQRALASLDRALRLTREPDPDPDPDFDDLADLVDRFARGGRMTVRLDAPPTGDLRPEVADTAHRIVTESLTNIRRHADSTDLVVVRVRREANMLVVSVSDEGSERASTPRPGGGTGLTVLAERVAALGGTLTAGPTQSGGWTVHAMLPVTP